MTRPACRFEEDVRQAAVSGRWTPPLSSHAASCAVCSEVQFVAEALHQRQPPATRLSIDPSALWACGRHARRISAEARAGLVVAAIEIGVLIGVLAIVLSFVDWHELWTSVASLRLNGETWVLSAVAVCTVAVAGLASWLSWGDKRI
jgi:hypothetical protein